MLNELRSSAASRILTLARHLVYGAAVKMGGSDPYDPATMDFKSPAARVTTARPTGAFAAGNALSMTAG